MKLALTNSLRASFFFLEHETRDNSIAINCQHKEFTEDFSQCPEFVPSEFKSYLFKQAEKG